MRKLIFVVLIFTSSLLAEKQSPMTREINNTDFPELEWKLPEVGKEIKRIELPSGTIVFLKENHSLPLLELNIYVKGGYYYIEEGKRGVSELLTKMIEKGGTEKYSPEEFTENLEIKGISFNLSENGYYYSVNETFSKDVQREALDFLEQALFHPVFHEDVMEIEEDRIISNWKNKMENPNSLLRELDTYVLYKNHPAGNFPDFERIENSNRETLKNVHRRFFQPKNMIVGITGDFNSEEMKSKVEKLFSGEYNNDRSTGKIPELTTTPEKRIFFYQMEIPQGYFYIQHTGEKAPFDDMYSVQLMNYILGGGGFTSRIVLKVRNEMGLAYSTRSYYPTFSPLSGRFLAYSATRSQAAHRASDAILKEINRIKEEKVTPEEYRTARESILNSTVTRLGNEWNYIPKIMELELLGLSLDYYENYNRNIKNVDVEDILVAAKKYLHPEDLHMVIIGDSNSIKMDSLRKQFGKVENLEPLNPDSL